MNQVQIITPLELLPLLQTNKAILIDVREPMEYQNEHIKESINIPLSDIMANNKNCLKAKNKLLVFQCRSGQRSMIACMAFAQKNSILQIANLEGGIIAWSKKNLPTQIAADQ